MVGWFGYHHKILNYLRYSNSSEMQFSFKIEYHLAYKKIYGDFLEQKAV